MSRLSDHGEMEDKTNGILTPKQYGKLILKLDAVRQSRNISKNKLSNLMGVSYSILLRYCNHEEFGLVDFDFLARACYVLNCDITDLIEYRNENKENK